MSETTLVRACLDYLTAQGCLVWRQNTGATTYGGHGRRARFVRFGPVGGSDLIGCTQDGRFVAVECKRGRNQPTEAQLTFLAEATQRGAFAACVWSIEELMQAWEGRDPKAVTQALWPVRTQRSR